MTTNKTLEWGNKKELFVSTTPLNTPMDIAKVRSVALYISLTQIGRSLIKKNEDQQVQGDLAESWKIENSQKKFIFNLAKGNYFSSGKEISVRDVVCSIERQIRLNVAIHFDFSTIERIYSAGNSVIFELKNPNPRFIQQMIHPEFSILTEENCKAPIDGLDLSITSGPYYLQKIESNGVILNRNKFFKDFSAPESLKVIGGTTAEVKSMLQSGQLDFSIGSGEMNDSELSDLKNIKKYQVIQPHIGFSYWLSVNPLNSDMEDKKNRLALISKLRRSYQFNSKLEPYWTKANQLYMPGGTGRLSEIEVEKYWKGLETNEQSAKLKIKSLNALLFKHFKFNNEILSAFKNENIQINVDYYENLREFEELLSASPKRYHLFQINNDFSAMDLFENLKVSFNPSRPLIRLGSIEKVINPLMKTAELSLDENEVGTAYRRIEQTIMNEGLIFPLAYNHVLFFVGKDISIEKWSKFYPKVAFWKILPAK